MRLKFLGTGTSIGVPAIGCQCEVCKSMEAKDKRLRSSAFLETDGGLHVLIDCGPDFRQQTFRFPFTKLDAVLITHIHFDHVGGIDDLRPFCLFGDVDIYCQEDVNKGLHQTMPYCFKEHLYPGVPHLNLHTIAPHDKIVIKREKEISASFPPSGANMEGVLNTEPRKLFAPAVKDTLEVTPIRVMHGNLPILGYVLKDGTHSLAYITDMKSMDDSEYEYLHDIDTLVINALRFEKVHHSHQLVDDAIEVSRRIGAKKTYFIHVTHDIGTHDIANSHLPEGFEFAYDGETIEI